MRSFLKSTRVILVLSIIAHAAGVVALLFSIGLLSFNDKKVEEPKVGLNQEPQVEQPTEVGTSEPQPTPEERAPVVKKEKAKPSKVKKPKIQSEEEVDAEAANEGEPAADVKIVTPEKKQLSKTTSVKEDEEAKLVPVKERPDGVAAQEPTDNETEAKSQDVQQNLEPAAEAPTPSANSKDVSEKTSPSAI